MTDEETLLWVLLALYFAECSHWLPHGAVAFASLFGERSRVVHPGSILQNDRGGLNLSNPLPLGTFCVCQQWPVSLSLEGMYSYVAQAINPEGRPRQLERYVRYDEVRVVEVEGKQVLVNGRPFVKTCAPLLAQHLARLLKRLSVMPSSERSPTLDAALGEIFDIERVAQQRSEYRRRSLGLRLWCPLLLVFVLLIVPTVLWVQATLPVMLWLLAAYVCLVVLIGVEFCFAHKALYPQRIGERRKQLVLVLCWPIAAVRARETLVRDLFVCFHPLAVAQVLCSPQAFRDFARHVLADLRHPILPPCLTNAAAECQTEVDFRVRLTLAAEAFLHRSGVDLEELLTTPSPDDTSCRSYCVRCRGQYVLAEGVCVPCGGQALKPLLPEQAVPLAARLNS